MRGVGRASGDSGSKAARRLVQEAKLRLVKERTALAASVLGNLTWPVTASMMRGDSG